MKRRTGYFQTLLPTSLVVLSLLLQGCGQPAESANTQDQQTSNDETVHVHGTAEFANQCPFGTTSQAYPARFDLQNCSVPGLQKLELSQAMTPLVIGADCVKKTLTVRSTDRSLDSTWEVLPDNTFSINVQGNPFTFASDGAGHPDCTSPTMLRMWGKLECPANPADIDKVVIKVEALWYLNQSDPSVPRTAAPSASQCSFPTGCFLHAIKEINQCG
jgi:hypothetical protein